MKYRKKPVIIEAYQNIDHNQEQVPIWFGNALVSRNLFFRDDGFLYVKTLEGDMKSLPGDFIIQGVKGEIYSCREDIFHQTYELVQ